MKYIVTLVLLLVFAGCSSLYVNTTKTLPTYSKVSSISLFALDNYTDTPQAGLRASNLIEGALLDHNYTVISAIDTDFENLQEQLQFAKESGSSHILVGGVSEWRYKTGIDGEPAISLHVKLINTQDAKVVWNATASSNDWGNASLGTTAQKMISSMFAQD